MSSVNSPLALCAGKQSAMRIGAPHVHCRDCLRLTRTEPATLPPALTRRDGAVECVNKVVA